VRQLRTELETQREEYNSIRDRATLAEWCDVFIDGRKADIGASTLEGYESVLETFVKPTLGAKRLATITVADLERFKNDLLSHVPASVTNVRAHRFACAYGGTEDEWKAKLRDRPIGARTVGKALTLITMVFNDAIRHQVIRFNPGAHVHKGKGQGTYLRPVDTRGVLTRSELEKLIDGAPERFCPMVMIGGFAGLRISECLGLQWGDVDFADHKIYVRRQLQGYELADLKTESSKRIVPVSDRLTLELKKWRLRCPKGEMDLVFPNTEGAPENASNVNNRLMKPAVVACGFEREELKRFTFHNLRHTFASVALTHAKLPLLEVSKMLGHSSMVVTAKVYVHFVQDRLDEIQRALSTAHAH
jgi:integrase